MAGEEPLTGGRLTSGVVRVGDTVRRPASPGTGRLLEHLAARGFAGSPRYLGRDTEGRDVLSYLPGQVVTSWQRWDDAVLVAVATLLRGLHEASRGFVATGFSMELASRYRGPDAVMCHHDPGPNNVVFREGRPVAFIDFDFAAPGHRLEDVGYLAWSWCVSSRPDRGPAAEQARQLRVLADAYGLDETERDRLFFAVRARLRRNIRFWQRRLDLPAAPEVLAWTRRELAHTTIHRSTFRGFSARGG